MVTVTYYHPPERFNINPAAVKETCLIHHQHAQAVAGLQQFRCGRVMAGSVSVDSHFLQQPNTVILQVIGQCATHTGMILVTVNTVYLHMLSIEEQSDHDYPDTCLLAYYQLIHELFRSLSLS
jgi:hypothetical protein